MSFLSGLRGMMASRPELPEKWKLPETEADVESVFSSEKPQVIYKHSYNCATCIFTKTKVENLLKSYTDSADFHFIDVISNRALSQLVARKSGVRHESPQLLILHNGKVFWSASHSAIREDDIRDSLDELNR